ncbi:hypothetical protein EJ06DRAFT_108751 [Trichodelitschia bisporula]|uniref:Uncharacterized protein n=1 Tax=Trichodelitschia bisporula TaxID=703511 RepID=A0A6G1HRS4_9PEZI|nr:hypothetical protein EJ06DRAFT_108751 [Trichodelitschia bisporula]
MFCRNGNVPLKDWDYQFGACEIDTAISGPMILARVDKAPLHPLHAAAFIKFAQDVMSPLFDKYQEEHQAWDNMLHFERQYHIIPARQKVSRTACKDVFLPFFEEYKALRVAGRPELLRPKHELSIEQQFEATSIPMQERIPHPEWESVVSPYDIEP